MAISKVQPMREAEIELVDTLNATNETLEQTNTVLGQVSQELGGEIERAKAVELALQNTISSETSRAQVAESALQLRIEATENDIDELETNIAAFPAFDYGTIDNIAIEAGNSLAAAFAFAEAKTEVPRIWATIVEVTESPETWTNAQSFGIHDVTENGFSYVIVNSSAYTKTFELNWLAIGD